MEIAAYSCLLTMRHLRNDTEQFFVFWIFHCVKMVWLKVCACACVAIHSADNNNNFMDFAEKYACATVRCAHARQKNICILWSNASTWPNDERKMVPDRVRDEWMAGHYGMETNPHTHRHKSRICSALAHIYMWCTLQLWSLIFCFSLFFCFVLLNKCNNTSVSDTPDRSVMPCTISNPFKYDWIRVRCAIA